MSERRLDRFSQIYLFGGSQLQDSERFRVRLSGLYMEWVRHHRAGIGSLVVKLIHRECGVEIRDLGKYRSVEKLIQEGDMRDVLDTISLAFTAMTKSNLYTVAELQNWYNEIERYFREENLAYRLGKNCTVHRFVDEEFHLSTAAALQGFSSPQLHPAKEALNRGIACLTGVHQDTKGAVVAVFEACEIVARNLVPEANNLYGKLCTQRLLPICMPQGADAAEVAVETGVFAAMSEWVNAVHNYRHGQAEANVVAPSFELAVQLVSMGCAFTRRLAQAYEAGSKEQPVT